MGKKEYMLEPAYYRRQVFWHRFITGYDLNMEEINQMAWPISSNLHYDDTKSDGHT
jgi:hypothetical protein